MTRVKICGLTALEDAQQAAELGAWALGMIFWPQQPAACPIEQAEAIGAQLHRRVELTGVFVNATLDEVATTADVCRFTLLQLHGDEGPAYCQEARAPHGLPRDQGGARARRRAGPGAARLPDRLPPARRALRAAPGGTGESFDWELARLHPRQAAADPLRRADAGQRGRGDRRA